MRNQIKLLDQCGLTQISIDEWQGREFLSKGKHYIDFASTNYLGFDFDPLLHQRGSEYVQKWGNISGWSRMEVEPEIYGQLEQRIGRLLNAKRVHLSHTITLTNFSLIPSIVKKGIIFSDHLVHTVVWEACRLARDHGAELIRFRHQDLNHLEELLKRHRHVSPKLITVDGVYSNSMEVSPIKALQELCRRYNAWLYVDDAHGFGILGERSSISNPYGHQGNGVVCFAKGDYSRTFYVASFGKAFCTYSAFASIPDEYEDKILAESTQYIYSAPPNPYLIGTVDAALDLNELRGDQERGKIRELVRHFNSGLSQLGLQFYNYLEQPVVFVVIGTIENLIAAASYLHDSGIAPALRVYPQTSATQCGFRFALSSMHQKTHVDKVLSVLSEMKILKMVA
jgi:8-amino-7-oxononanoate synthase